MQGALLHRRQQDLYFRYTPKKAYLLRYSTLYTFGEPSHKAGGQLVWSNDFGGDKVTVLVNCPPPR